MFQRFDSLERKSTSFTYQSHSHSRLISMNAELSAVFNALVALATIANACRASGQSCNPLRGTHCDGGCIPTTGGNRTQGVSPHSFSVFPIVNEKELTLTLLMLMIDIRLRPRLLYRHSSSPEICEHVLCFRRHVRRSCLNVVVSGVY